MKVVNRCYVWTCQSSDVSADFTKNAFERILMTYSFLERIDQPGVDLANDREESIPFVVLSASFIPIFLCRKCF
ncbi:hypothetical protein YC2023_051098 [Brassica napus]